MDCCQCVQEKYEEAMASLTQLEKRAVMAETMLEATIQYQSSQGKAQQPSSPSPRYLSLLLFSVVYEIVGNFLLIFSCKVN
jgi:hypothetical protein